MNTYFVYILASHKHGTLYVGVTNNLERRVWEHKSSVAKGFTSEYSVKQLVYYEECDSIEVAIAREKQLKNWKRDWKIQLIEKQNLQWLDLTEEWGNLNVLDSGSGPE
ncbi:MAG TPA: GIY-YIG nuclease family protein [Candidatus Saccharimonadales bacterium]|nr:GIY-YIG nuclease family protein [Candidatus Saccharimonadales bacterium]